MSDLPQCGDPVQYTDLTLAEQARNLGEDKERIIGLAKHLADCEARIRAWGQMQYTGSIREGAMTRLAQDAAFKAQQEYNAAISGLSSAQLAEICRELCSRSEG